MLRKKRKKRKYCKKRVIPTCMHKILCKKHTSMLIMHHCDDDLVNILLHGSSKYIFSTNNKTLSLKPLIHGQINLIKFIESNKFDNVTTKFDIFLFDQIS